MTVPTETVSLTVPHDGGFFSLFHMMLGGIALRRRLSLETLDDLQLAVDNILAEDTPRAGGVPRSGDISMSVSFVGDGLEIRVGPLTDPDLRETLLQGAVPAEAADRCIDVCLLLRSLVDGFAVHELGAGSFAVDLRKTIR